MLLEDHSLYICPSSRSSFSLSHFLSLHPFPHLAIVSQIGQMHLSNKYFPEAMKFIPERWIPEESPFPPVQEGSYYPFSAGAPSCMGKEFALMQLRLVVAALICNYDIELVKGQRTDYVQYVVAIVASGSYIITMKKRTSKQHEL